MLCELQISNFAIIEKQTVVFGKGLNVISGETGSGKSILLQALELILGGKAKQGVIRKGAETCEISALFDLNSLPDDIRSELPDIALSGGDELILTRMLAREGRGRVYINGKLGSLSLLEDCSRCLMNICGQGQFIRLMDSGYHLDLLDDFGANIEVRAEYSTIFDKWRALKLELEQLREKQNGFVLRRVELQQIIDDLDGIEIEEGIRERLDSELKVLANSETLVGHCRQAEMRLTEEGGLLMQLGAVQSDLQSLVRIDESAEGLVRGMDEVASGVDDFEHRLRAYVGQISVDQERLEVVREHLSEVARLERKYRCDDAGLVSLYKQAQKEVSLADDSEALGRMETELKSVQQDLEQVGIKLHKLRVAAGRRLGRQIEEELYELSMKEVRVQISVKRSEEFRKAGVDEVEFLIAANKGEDFGALKSIASGGELSRILLVIKKILRERSGVNILVFDEVDSGISGSVARAVGQKLKSLSKSSQVICITHLAQVASLAEHHLLIEKVTGERTFSRVRTLTGEAQVNEIARMLAGFRITDSSRESARELISSNQ